MLEEKATCCSVSVKTLILGCSGGSNAGQVANNLNYIGMLNSKIFTNVAPSSVPGFP